MRVVYYQDSGKKRVYQFSDEEKNIPCERCFLRFETQNQIPPDCEKKRFFYIKEVVEGSFAFCLKEAKTSKLAKYFANIFVDMFYKVREKQVEAIETLKLPADVAVHNTRNLNAEINTRLLSLLNEDIMMRAADKVGHVEALLLQKPKEFSRAIISVLQSTSQILNEYNVYDFLNPKVKLARADFSNHKVHKLCVVSFYLYEQEFREKKIQFNIQRSFDEVRINWSTARTAMAQILDNCLKYCKPGSNIDVVFKQNNIYLEIELRMTSLFFQNSEKSNLTLPGHRGKSVPGDKIKGKGMGMYIINRMIELNEGRFDFWANEMTKYSSGDYLYSENKFLVSLKKAF